MPNCKIGSSNAKSQFFLELWGSLVSTPLDHGILPYSFSQCSRRIFFTCLTPREQSLDLLASPLYEVLRDLFVCPSTYELLPSAFSTSALVAFLSSSWLGVFTIPLALHLLLLLLEHRRLRFPRFGETPSLGLSATLGSTAPSTSPLGGSSLDNYFSFWSPYSFRSFFKVNDDDDEVPVSSSCSTKLSTHSSAPYTFQRIKVCHPWL